MTTIMELLWIMALIAITLSSGVVLILWAAGSAAVWFRNIRQKHRQHAVNSVRQLWRQ